MIHNLEALVTCRDLFPPPDGRTARTAQAADQSLARGVVIRFYALYLDLPVHPGDRVHACASIYVAGADAVPACVLCPRDACLERPPAFERLDAVWPPEIEWLELLDRSQFEVPHVLFSHLNRCTRWFIPPQIGILALISLRAIL
jgi:hypothetical protein